MSPVQKEHVEQVRTIVHAVLAGKASKTFFGRIDGILDDWSEEKLSAPLACEKVQKAVGLFLGEDLALEIGRRCASIVMRETAGSK